MATNYTIGKHFEDLIERLSESGRYSTASEIMRDGLRLEARGASTWLPGNMPNRFQKAIQADADPGSPSRDQRAAGRRRHMA